MGRTAPPARVLVERELDRLRRAAASLRDPRDRELLLGELGRVYRVLEAYRYEPMADPLEPLLVLALLEIARLREECRNTRGSGSPHPAAGHRIIEGGEARKG